MKRRNPWIYATLVLAVAVGAMTVDAQSGRGRPTSVAVVDVMRALQALEETAQIEADLKTQFEGIKQEHQNRQDQLKNLKEDLDLLNPGSDAYKQKFNEFQLRAIELESWWKFQQASVSRERVLLITSLYRKLNEAVGKVASENGYDVVAFKEAEPDFRNINPDSLMPTISMRKLLWSRSDLDLTDQVILRLNNDWRNMRR